jgi:hypothetical protein
MTIRALAFAMLLQAASCRNPAPPADGQHGALLVRRVQLSDQPRFKYLVTVATADDQDYENSNGHTVRAGYDFYTNADLKVGQPVVQDSTPPYLPTFGGKVPAPDTAKAKTTAEEGLRVGDTVSATTTLK